MRRDDNEFPHERGVGPGVYIYVSTSIETNEARRTVRSDPKFVEVEQGDEGHKTIGAKLKNPPIEGTQLD